jgi:hypothetical protein
MTNRPNKRPAGITVPKEKAGGVRQIAAQEGFSYKEKAVPGRDDLIRFLFEKMDDADTQRLVAAIPRDVYAYRAVIGGGPPPGVLKKSRP